MKMKNFYYILGGAALAILGMFSSCKKYADTGAPINQVASEDVFKTDASANSAVAALYNNSNFNAYSGYVEYTFIGAISMLTGMAADEMYDVYPYYDEFKTNVIPVADSYNNNIWTFGYAEIYDINAAIEGLNAATTLTEASRQQWLGEAYTLRAFCFLYLTNLYGDVPLITTTSVATNANMPRTAQSAVYAQIEKDLTTAQGLLSDAYPAGTTLRVRINKAAATALLARTYLYENKWAQAEEQSSAVIGSGTYSMNTADNVFINTSNETILQLFSYYGYTQFGNNFVPAGSTPEYVVYDNLANNFEAGDLRAAKWLHSGVVSGVTHYYPYKYKLQSNVTTGNEYVVVLRLAEQYLIRAEARAQQNKLTGAGSALEDVQVVRTRAGLTDLTVTAQSDILLAIETERYHELFTEMGHRWLDLKRTGRANTVLGAQKSTWQSSAALFPIPSQQRTAVPALTQNAGYN